MFAARPNLALTILRVVVGFVFAMHGYQKFFQYGLDGVTGGFTQMGVPMAAIAAPVVTAVELIGGVMVILGIYHRWVALLQVGVMAGAILFAKLGGGFFAPAGIELELTLGAGALAIALGGGGGLTIQDMLKKSA